MSEEVKEAQPTPVVSCSFCQKTQKAVKFLVGGTAGVFICNECISICDDIADEQAGKPVDNTPETEDRLRAMWVQQASFMRLLQQSRGFPEFPTDITSKKGQRFLKDITHHMMDELFEAGQHLKNSKSHRATLVPEVDREAYKEELVDALHLYLELVIASGITLEELHEAYMKKGEVNFDRIRNGY